MSGHTLPTRPAAATSRNPVDGRPTRAHPGTRGPSSLRRRPGTARYLVAVVGPVESGKTVYFATLGHLLGETRMAPGVSAVIRPAHTAARLDAIHQRIADPAAAFPPPTPMQDITRWDVECGVSALGRSFPLMTVTYFDAAGEWFLRPLLDGPQSAEFHGLIEEPDAVLAFVDGEQLGRYLTGRDPEATFVAKNVRPILKVINKCSGPVHIVVTKWDLLRGRHTLDDVRRALLEGADGGLRAMVTDRSAASGRWLHSPGRVRLIPVTSLGAFAAVDGQGLLRKRPGMAPDPVNVLVPFAAVLPDLCTRAAEAAADAARARAERRRRAQREAGLAAGLEFTAAGLSIPLDGIAMAIAGGLTATSSGIARLVMSGRVPLGVALATLREPRLRKVRSAESAFRYLMQCLVRYLRDFERAHPASRLV
jgi:hypothetical protein